MEHNISNPHDSLKLIGEMITKARVNIASGAKYFLLWGWAAFLACMGQFLLQWYGIQHAYLIWMLMPLCAVATLFMSRVDDRRSRVRTFVEDGMGYLWTGMGIAFAILVIIFIRSGWEHSMPVFILLYATGTFISGKLLKFRPMVAGAILTYFIAVTSVWVPLAYHSLMGAAALLLSYIIPGHLLKKEN
jgi:hypothetical protein